MTMNGQHSTSRKKALNSLSKNASCCTSIKTLSPTTLIPCISFIRRKSDQGKLCDRDELFSFISNFDRPDLRHASYVKRCAMRKKMSSAHSADVVCIDV